MTASKQQIPAGTARTASIIVLVFAVMALVFGQSMFQTGSSPVVTARDLAANGLYGTVTDARAQVRLHNHTLRPTWVELTFRGSDDAVHTMETNHFPRLRLPVGAKRGWVENLSNEEVLVGQTVRYRVGEDAAVELEAEIPALAARGWTFPNYLGLVFMFMGAAAVVGGIIGVARAQRRLSRG